MWQPMGPMSRRGWVDTKSKQSAESALLAVDSAPLRFVPCADYKYIDLLEPAMSDDSPSHDEPRAKFYSMENGTLEDWTIINKAMVPFVKTLPDRVLSHLQMLAGDCGGYAI